MFSHGLVPLTVRMWRGGKMRRVITCARSKSSRRQDSGVGRLLYDVSWLSVSVSTPAAGFQSTVAARPSTRDAITQKSGGSSTPFWRTDFVSPPRWTSRW
jgi:hypothetical protein